MRTQAAENAADRVSGLEELYVRNAPWALRTAYFLTGDRDLAEDLVQEAFVRVAGRFGHIRQPDAFPGYLRRTIVNLFTSQLRRRALEREWLRRQEGEAAAFFEGGPEPSDDLWRALATLPARQRAAVVLRYYDDLPEREAASVLGCSTGAFHQLVVRATTTLRQQLEGAER